MVAPASISQSQCQTTVPLRGREAASEDLGVLLLTSLAVIALKRNPVGQPRGHGGSRALQESITVGKRKKMAYGAPPTSGSVQRDSLKLHFNMVGYK